MAIFFGSVVANATNSATTYVSNINWAEPTWDLFIVLFFIIAGFLYGMSLGKDRIIIIIISIYMSLAVVNTPPVMDVMKEMFAVKMSTFLVIFILLFFFLSRSALLKALSNTDSRGSWWQVILFSILHVGLLVSITLSFLPPESLEQLSPLTKTLFAGDYARFGWIVAPIVMMILIKGDSKKKIKYDL
ncbi:MAG: hypothetical protein U5L76_00730 [Patescibacteria group bacterium]|nr:hypothetical protein [Patescibacteria group bacterium]